MKNSLPLKKQGESFRASMAHLIDSKLDPEQKKLFDEANKVPKPEKPYKEKQNQWWKYA